MQQNDYSNDNAISIRSGGKFGVFEHDVQVDFSLIDLIHGQCVFTPRIQHHMKSRALYGKGFGLMKRTLNLAIQTGRTEELYELHQQYISEMERQLAEQEGRVLQSDDEYNYDTISNPLNPRTKGRKRQKRIAAFNDGARKKVSKETTNLPQNEDLVRTANSNLNNESINVDSTEGVEGSEEQGQIMHEQIQDVQGQEQGKKKRAYICGNCGQDGHRKSCCPNQ
ncbi:13349_t:CDS:2, partial [Racocetra fulgida]